MTAVEAYKTLESHFKIKTHYKVSFDKNLSPDCLEVIEYLKGDLFAQDIVPNYPTSINIVVTLPATAHLPERIENFYQDSHTYIEAFDKGDFQKFLDKCLSAIPSN